MRWSQVAANPFLPDMTHFALALHARREELVTLASDSALSHDLYVAIERFFPTYGASAVALGADLASAIADFEPVRRMGVAASPTTSTPAARTNSRPAACRCCPPPAARSFSSTISSGGVSRRREACACSECRRWAFSAPAKTAAELWGALTGSPGGLLAVIADPSRAAIFVCELDARPSAQLVNESRTWAMSSLHTGDGQGATAYYEAVFGWQPQVIGPPDAPVTLFRLPGCVGGEAGQPMARDVVAAMAPPRPPLTSRTFRRGPPARAATSSATDCATTISRWTSTCSSARSPTRGSRRFAPARCGPGRPAGRPATTR